jgi:thiamine pyrophosphate-dependent acetolactate synthase large subunit-like protein
LGLAQRISTGIADAFLDRAPMVAITGQAASSKLHKEAHQVVDIVRMLEPVTKWNTRVERPDSIPEVIRKAFRLATLEKPGPTHVEIPEDLAAESVSHSIAPLSSGRDLGLVARADGLVDRRRRRGHREFEASDQLGQALQRGADERREVILLD